MDDLLAEFLTETNESLAELDTALLRLERVPDDAETLGLIFRLVHTIKGTCGFLALARLEKVAHAAENVLGSVRDGSLAVTAGLVSTVLAAIDRIKMIVDRLGATGEEPPGDDSALIAALDALMEGAAPEAPGPALASPPAPVTAPATAPATAPLAALSAEPPRPVMASPKPPEPPAAMPAAEPVAEAGGNAEQVAAQTIRVSVDVLENLMTLVSELVLSRNQLMQLARTHEAALGAFSAPLQRLSHITSDLQEGVMKTRMQPIGNAWNKLPRLVRDLSHELGKRIELVMLGAETELDRQVLELIKDPLTHMVRNSADHGIESGEQRRAAGKPRHGTITLNAYHEGGHIIIEVGDDGRGLAADKIAAKALQSGLATEGELASMSEAQLQRFIFRAGFSTAAAVTAVSGRGVGMDVVKTNIERIGGAIDLRSTPGIGTVFTIKIPLTLAIVSALIVEAAGERFAIPQISVVELVRATGDGEDAAVSSDGSGGGGGGGGGGSGSGIEYIDKIPFLRRRDRLLPLVPLGELMGLSEAHQPRPEATIVIAQVGAHMIGLMVDRVFDTEEIVVKPVAPILRHISMFSGNTILGDGSVIMILDPNGIARASGVGSAADMRVAAAPRPAAVEREGERMALLLFRAGSSARMAVPLAVVARLEEFPREKIEYSCGQYVSQYRGQLMPLIALAGAPSDGPTQPVLVFADGGHSLGLMVDQIMDVVEESLAITLPSTQPGLLGTAVIGGIATDMVDTDYWLRQNGGNWFRKEQKHARLLLVEDSAFFRHMLVPILRARGYEVMAVGDAAEALRLRDSGQMFEAIVSDIEMPGTDGIEFVRAVRGGGAWASLPVIALSARADPHHVHAGRNAGFTDYVAKFDRDALLSSLEQCLLLPSGVGP